MNRKNIPDWHPGPAILPASPGRNRLAAKRIAGIAGRGRDVLRPAMEEHRGTGE